MINFIILLEIYIKIQTAKTNFEGFQKILKQGKNNITLQKNVNLLFCDQQRLDKIEYHNQ